MLAVAFYCPISQAYIIKRLSTPYYFRTYYRTFKPLSNVFISIDLFLSIQFLFIVLTIALLGFSKLSLCLS